jgi:type IV pilus assembly protein PilA
MNKRRTMLPRTRRSGFSLVEVLAVVIILAVLSAVAVPLYINTRKAAAARACLGNLAAIAAAESAFALRNGVYIATPNGTYVAGVAGAAATGGLVGAPEGLSAIVVCPLTNTDTYTANTAINAAGQLTITCGNAAAHATVVGTAATYTKTMAAPPLTEAIP